MFTGLIEAVGEVAELKPLATGFRLRISTPLSGEVSAGESIAISGVCLTVIVASGGELHADISPETARVSSLGGLKRGSLVNLERPLAANGRLGGHFVQGHVDGVGVVDTITRDGEWVTIWFRAPEGLAEQMVSKGSITVDGVSLTLVEVERARFSVALIPHTLAETTLGTRCVGDVVNIETDILAKYVHKLMNSRN